MIRLNLSNRPEWLDLLPGLRVLVAPLTTALMVSARADPAIDGLSETSSQEDMALAMAKAVARRAVLDWEGSATMTATSCPSARPGSMRSSKSGRSSRPSRRNMSPEA